MTSAMATELAEAPDVVRRMLVANRKACEKLGQQLRERPPRLVVTCGRGSSGHVTTFAKYLIETHTGVPVSAAAPSVSSVYQRRLHLEGQVVLMVSQSGRSPDLLSFASNAKAAGATVITAVNDTNSPLASLGHVCLPLGAGLERSVAATKSVIASLATVVQLVASWIGDDDLKGALDHLPDALQAGRTADWSAAEGAWAAATDAMVLGRGLGLGVAQEAALKLKETCAIQAESFSAAELYHGPMALVRDGYPLLVFSQNDETRIGISALVADLREKGADVWVVESGPPAARRLAVMGGPHFAIAPIVMTLRLHRFAHDVALRRGLDPDRPPHLRKITETL